MRLGNVVNNDGIHVISLVFCGSPLDDDHSRAALMSKHSHNSLQRDADQRFLLLPVMVNRSGISVLETAPVFAS
jgi:hypothetical protein